uniref:Uncharacterized protein n=1 Tax=Anopheles farauti TaxID=69004 RepID=A0A182QQ32_9DIPT
MWPVIATILFAVFAAVAATNDAFNIELKQKDAEVYHEQSFGKSTYRRDEFNYGYQVERTNSQFQHKVKGPDDVTYGCYGYIDPDGEKHLVYYIADRLGYRLLAPDQPTKVFTDRVANSVNRLDADLQGRKLDEKVVAWNDLYLPSTCRRLNEIVSITPPPTTERPVPVVPGGAGANGGEAKVSSGQPTGAGGNGIGSFEKAGTDDVSNGSGNAGVLSTTPAYPDIQESNKSGLSVSVELPDTGSSDHSSNSEVGPNGRGGSFGEDTNGRLTGDDRLPSSTPSSLGPQQITSRPVASTPVPPPQVPSQTTPPESSPAPQPIDPIDRFPPQTTYLPIAPTNRPPTVVRVPDQLPTPSSQPPANCAQNPFAPRPKHPSSIAQFNGFVFPINRNCDDSGRNTADLLAQMQSLNEMVLKVSSTLQALVETDGPNRTATCQRVLDLLHIQQPVPLLVYVPIMVPYLDGGINASKPPINPASYAYAKTCTECK